MRKKSGFFSQIDLIIALPQGLVCVEVKDYSGWLFGNEGHKYWTQILNYGKEKHHFYNPILQNEGNIKTLREQSEQFSKLPIYNIVLFTNECTLKDITYNSDIKYVGYTSDVMDVLKKIREFTIAKYTNKNEVVYILNEAVRRGDNPEIRSKHVEFI